MGLKMMKKEEEQEDGKKCLNKYKKPKAYKHKSLWQIYFMII